MDRWGNGKMEELYGYFNSIVDDRATTGNSVFVWRGSGPVCVSCCVCVRVHVFVSEDGFP